MIPSEYSRLDVAAKDITQGDVIANVGIVDKIAVIGVFHVLSVRGTVWSLATGTGDEVQRDLVLHEAEGVIVFRSTTSSQLDEDKPSIIGRERALIDGLAKLVHKAGRTRHDHTSISQSRRGSYFSVHILDPDGKPTGHIARVTIELDRFEAEKN